MTPATEKVSCFFGGKISCEGSVFEIKWFVVAWINIVDQYHSNWWSDETPYSFCHLPNTFLSAGVTSPHHCIFHGSACVCAISCTPQCTRMESNIIVMLSSCDVVPISPGAFRASIPQKPFLNRLVYFALRSAITSFLQMQISSMKRAIAIRRYHQPNDTHLFRTNYKQIFILIMFYTHSPSCIHTLRIHHHCAWFSTSSFAHCGNDTTFVFLRAFTAKSHSSLISINWWKKNSIFCYF